MDVPIPRKLDWNSQGWEHKTQEIFHYLYSYNSLARKTIFHPEQARVVFKTIVEDNVKSFQRCSKVT